MVQMESVVIGFIFIANAASIVLLIFLLFRILSQTEQTHEMMRAGSADIIDSSKRLRDMLQSVDRLSERLVESNKSANGGQAQLNISTESINKLCALTESLTKESLEEHEQVMGEMRKLLESLQGVKPEGYSAWQHTNQDRIDHTLHQRPNMSAEMEQLKIRLDEANIVIDELKHASRQANAAAQSADVLRQNMDKQQQLLNRAKERVLKAEAEATTLTQEISKLSSETDRSRKETALDLAKLTAQMAAISKERDALFNQLKDMKGVMQRTLVEKEFIEDKLLDLDEAQYASAGKAAPSS